MSETGKGFLIARAGEALIYGVTPDIEAICTCDKEILCCFAKVKLSVLYQHNAGGCLLINQSRQSLDSGSQVL